MLIPIAGVAFFTYIIAIRMAPPVRAAPDHRLDRIPHRIYNVVTGWPSTVNRAIDKQAFCIS